MKFKDIQVFLFSFSNYLFSIPIVYFGLASYSNNEIRADWQPPGYVFGIVWPILYLLFGIINLRIYYSKKIPIYLKKANLELSFQESILQTVWLLVNGKYGEERHCYQHYFSMIVMLYLLVYAYFLRPVMLYETNDKSILLMYIPYVLWIGFASILNYQTMKKCLDNM
tara:strand:+ start:288 stop:791 length:504 start_codon:yes stop_codon:yes gene_type:complete